MNGFSVIFTDVHCLRVWPGSAKLEEDEQIHDQFQHRNKHILFTRGTTMLSIHNSWHWDWWMNACLFVQLLRCQDSPAGQIIPHQTCAQLRGRQQLFGEGPALYKDESLSIDRTNPGIGLNKISDEWLNPSKSFWKLKLQVTWFARM